ncbi:2-polyprenyl-6-methoxyphenol hydroxylase [Microlunatus flavus]|uniref:2-polyprenyl-6-methoxyphenol hydroxylase n=2 Tax=Microlunatus flavus TaxID=1036181 RepID=A0A1H9APG7_9ACTN|nr:2-polyprenyl-6-methoxyphenol hydroxylase [Microlunatus flavus]
MAALVLARRGVPVVVVDRKAGPTRESRAIVLQARSMELYDQLGLVEKVLAGSYLATRLQVRPDRPAQSLRVDRAQQGATRFPGLRVFEQSRNESLLVEALDEAGVSVRWRHRLVDLMQEDGPEAGVTALVEGPDGLSRVRARWCVGADGAASVVRRLLDVPFEGVTDDATFWVADLRGVPGTADDAIVARFGDATFALVFPLGPGGHVRLISLASHDGVDQEEALAGARADLGLRYDAVDWFSTYRVHHRVAARFRTGPVFLAGDAAHVHSPVGAQGMNTGLQDAHDLAHLLADVAHDHVTTAALDRYEGERRPVALRLVRLTDRVFGVVGRRGRGPAWVRRRFSVVAATLLPSLLERPAGARLGGWLGQYRIRYHLAASATPPAWADDPAVGVRLPPAGENAAALRDLTWQLHTYGGNAARPDVPGWVDGPRDLGPDDRRRLRPDRLYLVRPDGFVVASLPLAGGRVDDALLGAALEANHVVRGPDAPDPASETGVAPGVSR